MVERKVLRDINLKEVREYIKNSSKESSIYIGCDSQQKKKHTYFAVVVIIHIDSSSGGKVFVETSKTPRITSLKQRLLKEVEIASELALEIVDVIGDRHLEVHLDVNPNPAHKSNIICKEAIGWITGLGFDAKIKHDSWAASSCADHCIRI